MKTSFALLAAASLAAIASPAAAQDAADNTFTGLWGGVIGGYDVSKAGSSVDNDNADDDDQSIDGFAYGVQLGYDVDLGGVVIGAEAEYSDSTAEVEVAQGDVENFGFGNVETGRDLYFGARVGAKVGPDAMIYAKGGYTNAKYNVRSSDGTTEFNQDLDTDGYRIGAGAEYALSDNAFVKLEYRYSNYSEAEVDFEGDAADTPAFDIDTDRHQVMAGVGFRF
jgi:outer membrane immunogenic protein